jgi:hypothetical protein
MSDPRAMYDTRKVELDFLFQSLVGDGSDSRVYILDHGWAVFKIAMKTRCKTEIPE